MAGNTLRGVTKKQLQGTFAAGEKGVTVVRLCEPDKYGGDRVDIRRFWHPPKEGSGTYVATRRGIGIPIEDLPNVIEMLEAALEAFYAVQEEADGNP